MFYQPRLKVSFIALFCLFFVINTCLYSQKKEILKPSGVAIMVYHSKGGGTANLDKTVKEDFIRALKEKGQSFNNNDFSLELLLNVKKIKGTNKIAISVVQTLPFPKAVVDLGAKNEIFYAVFDSAKRANLPAKGKFVREDISKGYMQQFRTIQDDNLEIIDIDELNNFAEKTIARIFVNRKDK